MSKQGLVIAVDGPSASGKSATARLAAGALGYRYIDSGAMYRAVTLKAAREGLKEEGEIVDMLSRTRIEFSDGKDGPRTFLDGIDVSSEIRTPDVTARIAPISEMAAVRAVLVDWQRVLGRGGGVVMDGRDIGTVVFPDADVKVYLTADPQERASRRLRELAGKGIEASLDDVKRDLVERDLRNASRQHGPDRQADDAVLLDCTGLTLDQQVEAVVSLAVSRGARRLDRAGCVQEKTQRTRLQGDVVSARIRPVSSIFYRFCRRIVWLLLKTLLRIRVEGVQSLPREGGVILAGNHTSFVDPPLVGICVQRELSFLAKKELFQIPILGGILPHLNVIPVNREGMTRQTLKKAVEILRQGKTILVFPEGTRSKTGDLGRAKAGIGFLAAASECQVVPVAISGTYRLWRTVARRRQVLVRFGEPMIPLDPGANSSRKGGYQLVGDHLMQQIAAMRSQDQNK